MPNLENTTCDEALKFIVWPNLKTLIVRKLKNSNCDKNQIVTNLNNSNCDKTQKLKLKKISKANIVKKTQKLKLWQN